MYKLAIVLFALLLPAWVRGQERILNSGKYGISGGLTVSFGTHVKRLGIAAAGYRIVDHLQINGVVRLTLGNKRLGPSAGSFEWMQGIGLVYGFRSDIDPGYNHFVHSVSNQMKWRYAVGYAYNFYWDNWGTSQRTGTIGLSMDQFELIHENDALGAHTDRYRTAALLLTYRDLNNRLGINTTLWTGDANDPAVIKIDSASFARFGYKDLSNAKYGKISHGLISAQWDHAIDFGQTIRLNVGIDAEQVRNVVQNKLMHDMYLWPKKWNTARNPHIAMLDSEGNPYIFRKKGQRIKPSRFLFQCSLNENQSY